MFDKFFNLRIFWGVRRERMEDTGYTIHVWTNPFLDEKHVIFFPEDLEGNWRELQRRRKANT